MRRRFFVDGFTGRSAVLSGEAAHHLGRVLRAESGQLYELSDGKSAWLARTETVGRDEIHFSLVESLPVNASPLRITLLLAIVKFDRFEWAIEKATELGADEVVPLAAERSEKGLLAAAVKRAGRWERILTESAQQARRLRVPGLRETAKSQDAFRNVNAQIRLLLSERANASPMRELLEPAATSVNGEGVTSVAVAIGPEGGWTDAEFSACRSAGFAEAALGINILRTETAVCAALAAVQYAFGAFRSGGELQPSQTEARKENDVSEPASGTSKQRPEWNANLYDAKHAFVWKHGSDVISLLAPQSGERILDLGGGTGHLTAQIAACGVQVLGIDRSPEMVAAARTAYPNLKFDIADARALPFRSEFDAVFSNAALHWIHEPLRVIQGVWNALRSGGRFVAEFGGKGNIAKMQSAFDQALVELHLSRRGEVNPWYYPSVSEYATLLENNNFEVRFMTLFDRPTALADGETGMRNWVAMFGSDYLAKVPPEMCEVFFQRVEVCSGQNYSGMGSGGRITGDCVLLHTNDPDMRRTPDFRQISGF